jgi:PAS domain S-box-containing protein
MGYLVAVGAVAAVALLRLALTGALGDEPALLLFVMAVTAAAWYGGWKPGLFAVVLGVAAETSFFGSPWLHKPGGLLRVVLFVGVGGLVSLLSESLHRSRRRAEVRREALRVTLASMGDAVITADDAGRVASLNPVAETLTGWRRDKAKGRPLEDVFRIVNEQSRQPVENPVKKVLGLGQVVGLANHTVLIARDGTERAIDGSAAPIRDTAGQVTGVVLIFRDITERRRVDQKLVEAHAFARRLAAIVESSDDPILSISLDGIIQSWNDAAVRLFGYPAEQAVGRHISFLIPADRIGEEEQILARLRAGERVAHFDTVRLRSDGQPVHVSLTISPLRDEAGWVVGASKIARDMTKEKEAEERIYGLLTELRAADRRKDEFLATLAHELRGPLAPLRNLLEVLKRADGDGERARQAYATMDRQLSQLTRLVDDLLDVSRISRGKIELRRERVELASVVSQAVEACRPLAESAGHEVAVTLPPEPLVLDGDPVRLAQVFGNLLNNACKYTDRGGRIGLTVERQGSDVVVRVTDNGAGIPADQLGSIFEMFTQVDETLERSQGGLGIGLTLVRRLVELHGGSVEAFSEGRGRGSEFVVRLPLLSEKPRALRRRESIGDATPAPARRILVVDDNRDSAESLALLLTLSGHQTQTAHDGLEAVEAAGQFRPDVVLLDIGLPKLNGYDACRRIREQAWGLSMVLVALTGWGQDADRRRSHEAGFDAHLVKPVDLDALRRLLIVDPFV